MILSPRPRLLLIAAAVSFGAAAPRAGVEGSETAVRIEAPDKLVLEGVLVQPADRVEGARAAVVVVLHGVGRDRESLEDVINALTSRGVLVLAVDLRGHGQSRRTTDQKLVSYPYLRPADFRRMVDDQKLVVDWVAARPEVDPSRIAVVGVGLGSLVGAQAAGRDPRIGALALVGPMNSGYGLSADTGLVAMGERPVWMGTSKTNDRWMGVAERLASIGTGERTIAGYEAPVASTSELLQVPALIEDLAAWLDGKLAPRTP